MPGRKWNSSKHGALLKQIILCNGWLEKGKKPKPSEVYRNYHENFADFCLDNFRSNYNRIWNTLKGDEKVSDLHGEGKISV